MPEPAAISFLGSGPSAARLSGMNIITEPTARRMSGQKIVWAPVSGLTPHEQRNAGAGGHHRADTDHQARIVASTGICP